MQGVKYPCLVSFGRTLCRLIDLSVAHSYSHNHIIILFTQVNRQLLTKVLLYHATLSDDNQVAWTLFTSVCPEKSRLSYKWELSTRSSHSNQLDSSLSSNLITCENKLKMSLKIILALVQVAILSSTLVTMVVSAPPNPTVVTNTNMRGPGSTTAPKETAMYIRVIKKMDEFCAKPYKSTDDKQIESYSKCFSQLIKAVSFDFFIRFFLCLSNDSYANLAGC